MIDGKTIRNRLVGSDDERAVSPVIGVILMVAITVILAAVIAAFVLDLGDDMGDGNVNAGVSTDVDNTGQEVSISVDSMGDADYFVLGGDAAREELDLSDTGSSTAVSNGDLDGAEDVLEGPSGEANIVAVSGDSESVVGSFEWDWSEELTLSENDAEAGNITVEMAYEGEVVNGDVDFNVTNTNTGEQGEGTITVDSHAVSIEDDDLGDGDGGAYSIDAGEEYEIEASHDGDVKTITVSVPSSD